MCVRTSAWVCLCVCLRLLLPESIIDKEANAGGDQTTTTYCIRSLIETILQWMNFAAVYVSMSQFFQQIKVRHSSIQPVNQSVKISFIKSDNRSLSQSLIQTVNHLLIVTSKLIKRHSIAKRKAPVYSWALQWNHRDCPKGSPGRGGRYLGVHAQGKLRSDSKGTEKTESSN